MNNHKIEIDAEMLRQLLLAVDKDFPVYLEAAELYAQWVKAKLAEKAKPFSYGKRSAVETPHQVNERPYKPVSFWRDIAPSMFGVQLMPTYSVHSVSDIGESKCVVSGLTKITADKYRNELESKGIICHVQRD